MSNSKISALTSATTPLAGTEVLPIVQSGATKQVSVANLTAGRAVSVATLSLASDAGSLLNAAPITGTAATYFTISNTGGSFYVGKDNSAGSNFGISYASVLWNSGAYPILFATNGTRRVSIDGTTGDTTISTGNLVIGTSGKGIDFSATPGTGTSELLADYEEGTFTPTIIGTTTAGTGTYTTQIGRYTKVGNRVHFSINVEWTAHTGTGFMRVAGLPFTVASGTRYTVFPAVGNDLVIPSNMSLTSMTFEGFTTIILYTLNTTSPMYTNALAIDTSSNLYIAGTYQT